MNLRQLLSVLRRRWLILVVCALLGTITGIGIAVATPAPYKSIVRLVVGTCGEGSVDQAYACTMFADNRSSTYLSLLNGPTLAEAVVDDLDLDVSAADLGARLSVTAEQQSALFDITVLDDDAATAEKIAASAAVQADELVVDVDRPDADPQPLIGVSQVGDPSAAVRDGRSKVSLAAVGLLAGLIVGIVAAVVRAATDPALSSLEDLDDVTDLPTLAGPDDDPGRIGRRLRAALIPRLPSGQSSVLLVTGVGDAGSSSAAATGLAEVLADPQHRVVLLETDSAPDSDDLTAEDAPVDLASLLADPAGPDRPEPAEPYRRIASGLSAADRAAVLPGAVHAVVQQLRKDFDYIVVDARDIDADDLTETFAADADFTVVTVLDGATRTDTLDAVLTRLPRIGASVVGVAYATARLS